MKLISFRRLKFICIDDYSYKKKCPFYASAGKCCSKNCPIWKKLKDPVPEIVYRYCEEEAYL